MKDQLSLFAGAPSEPPAAPLKSMQIARDLELAAALPSWLRLGTSSWTFAGWENIFYEAPVTQKNLLSGGLRAYAENKLFSTVGIDRSYYGPIPQKELDAYAAGLPDRFSAVSKIWADVTTYIFPDHPSAGERAGKKNPNFLNPEIVNAEILPAFRGAFQKHAGPFIFEIPPIGEGLLPSDVELTRAMDHLLKNLPADFAYAFEPRNFEMVSPRYLACLRAHRAAHVFAYWSGLPPLVTQLKIPNTLPAPFVIARIMQPPRTRYEQLREAYAPFNRIVKAQPDMHADVVRLVRMCAESGKQALFVLVGNKSEGCAPITVRALAEDILAELRA